MSGVKTAITSNGADEIEWNFPTYEHVIKNKEVDSGVEDKFPKPVVILSGLFWLVSLLSFLGGGWKRFDEEAVNHLPGNARRGADTSHDAGSWGV